MTIRHAEELRDSKIAAGLAEKIRGAAPGRIRLMEVCGTHTMSIFRSGIRGLLPETIRLLSGPGCPVCVTAQGEIDAFIEISRKPSTIVATFGDLLRVPGTASSLQQERAEGADVRVVYSTFDALSIAEKNPGKRVVFLGVGFETTAPTIAASLVAARQRGLANYFVFSAHKLVPPALDALMASGEVRVDGFLLPGHVSVIIGSDAYLPFVKKHRIPCVVAGFEPADILHAILMLAQQIRAGEGRLENAYPRAVAADGNPKARQLMEEVFRTVDASWRGLGEIPKSGLKIGQAFAAFDAEKALGVSAPRVAEPKGCSCGRILTGAIIPPECPLYKKACTPMSPVGPCMVSSEGTCAAYYRYHSV